MAANVRTLTGIALSTLVFNMMLSASRGDDSRVACAPASATLERRVAVLIIAPKLAPSFRLSLRARTDILLDGQERADPAGTT
jgi:hypothetical protein